jgi:hypothetical protein
VLVYKVKGSMVDDGWVEYGKRMGYAYLLGDP